jgi:hypothetical protein
VTRRRVLGLLAGATALLVVLLAFGPISTERLLSIYVLVVAAIALAGLVRLAQPERSEDAPASEFERALRARTEEPKRPPELVRTERELTLGMSTAGHAHHRLLPLLRASADARLLARHGVDPARRPAAARELLGDEAWELLRPDRPAPEDRHGPGLRFARIAAVVERIEAL